MHRKEGGDGRLEDMVARLRLLMDLYCGIIYYFQIILCTVEFMMNLCLHPLESI